MPPSIQTERPMCRFPHEEEAVARFAMSEGCVCYPDDRVQDLCAQHANDSQPFGSMELLIKFDPRWPW